MKNIQPYKNIFTGINRISFAAVFIIFIGYCNLFPQDVISDSGMVASAHPLASQAGLEILRQGGNAVDAAVATALALGVVEPNASGLGGGGFMVIKMTGQKAITIDFREAAPQAATGDFYYDSLQKFSMLTENGPFSIGTPGDIAGLSMALEKFGTMSLKQVLAPALKLARDGFPVSEKFAGMVLQAYELIMQNDATSAIYLIDGLPPNEGTIIKNPGLVSTFEDLAKKGAGSFYSGEIAEKIISEVKNSGGILSARDLAEYKALEKAPVSGSYKNFRILSSAPPTGGGTHLIELLNILENYDLKKMGHNSAEYIHVLAEAMKIIFTDKEQNMADPAFYKVPVEKLTDKSYAKDMLKFIKPGKASFDYKSPDMISRESGSTTHLSTADMQGNVVALTQSINFWFGSGITVAGTGIILNNHLADFADEKEKPNSIEPYKRPVSSIAPTIILKDGQPFLTIGSPGGSRIISALAQIIINIIDFNMGIDEAIEAPRVHAFENILHVEGRISADIISKLEKIGHKVKVHADFDNYFGGAQGILINPETHSFSGGADSRRDGMAVGY